MSFGPSLSKQLLHRMSLITRNAKEDRSMRLQTIETSSLPIDSSRPLFKHFFLAYWLYISTVSTFLIYALLTRVLPRDFAQKDFVFWARSQRGQLYGLFIMDLSLWLLKTKTGQRITIKRTHHLSELYSWGCDAVRWHWSADTLFDSCPRRLYITWTPR